MTTEERIIEKFNQMECPGCHQKLRVQLSIAQKGMSKVIVPISLCCNEGTHYVEEQYQTVYNSVIAEECKEILNF